MNQINRDARLPLYHQLYEILHETILLGKCKPGDRLPTESELLGTYGVSRITVRKILGEIKMQRAKSKNKEVAPTTRAFRHCDFSCLIFDIRWGLALIMCVALAGAPARANVVWIRKSSTMGHLPAPNAGSQQTCCVVCDVDNDGIDDFVVGERTRTPSVVWYKYNGTGWNKYVIDDTPLKPEAGGDAFDIDRDGDTDIVFGQDARGRNIWWWENPYPKFGQPWTRRHIKNTGANKHHDQSFADYDGDGRAEFVTWNQQDKKLLFYEIPDDPRGTQPWPFVAIYQWSQGRQREGFPSIPVDIDLDGTVDIVGGGRWFKYTGRAKFKEHVIDGDMTFTQCAAGQLVKGGRPEVVFSPGDMDGDAKWYRWQGGKWTAHTLRRVLHGHTCEIRDIDRDGNLDVMIGEMGEPGAGDEARIYIWYGDGKGHFRETVAWHGQGIHEGRLGDFDGDGDLDILLKPYHHNSPRIDILLNGAADSL